MPLLSLYHEPKNQNDANKPLPLLYHEPKNKNNTGIPLPLVYPEPKNKNDASTALPLLKETYRGTQCQLFNHDHKKIINFLRKEDTLRTDSSAIANRRKGLSNQIYVPSSLRDKLIRDFHENNGHIGTKKSLQMISKSYFWPNMTKDVKNYTDSCETCQLNKIKRCQKLGTLSSFTQPENSFDLIAIDTVGGLEGYNSNQNTIQCLQ